MRKTRKKDAQMKAPQIDRFLHAYDGGRQTIDDRSKRLLDQLFEKLDQIAPCGDDNRHELWLEAPRGTIEDYGDFDYELENEIVSSREEFESNWAEDYPHEVSFYHLTTAEHKGYRNVVLNGKLVIRYEPGETGFDDLSKLLAWLIESVERVVSMLRAGSYNAHIREALPFRYRTGVLPVKDYWEAFPEQREDHFKQISEHECVEFDALIHTPADAAPIQGLTVNHYLEICALGYRANRVDGYETKTPLELYKRNADDRDGGLLTIDPDSPEAFSQWYDIPSQDKWEIENPSHMWEVMQGSSRTRTHLYVIKKDGGYALSLSANEYCCPEYAVRFYLALRHNGVPVDIFKAEEIADYLLGRGKVGFVPCFTWPTDYFYGGFSDKTVMEFRHFPEEQADKLAAKTEWYPIAEVSLR